MLLVSLPHQQTANHGNQVESILEELPVKVLVDADDHERTYLKEAPKVERQLALAAKYHADYSGYTADKGNERIFRKGIGCHLGCYTRQDKGDAEPTFHIEQ